MQTILAIYGQLATGMHTVGGGVCALFEMYEENILNLLTESPIFKIQWSKQVKT